MADATLSIFRDLSRALTGAPIDRADLAALFLAKLQRPPTAADLDRLLQVFGAVPEPAWSTFITGTVMTDPAFKALAKSIILLWYVGDATPDPRPPAGRSEEAYFGGLLWPLIGAHPPGLSGGYFGHWTYPPDAA